LLGCGALLRPFSLFSPPQANGGAAAYINQPQILVGDLLGRTIEVIARQSRFRPFFTLLANSTSRGNFASQDNRSVTVFCILQNAPTRLSHVLKRVRARCGAVQSGLSDSSDIYLTRDDELPKPS